MTDRVNASAAPEPGANRRNFAFFIHDRSGNVAVEFAMIALPFLLLIVAILEYSYGNFAQSRLEAAAAQAARQIMTGHVQGQTVGGKPLTASQFRDKYICPKLTPLLNCKDVYVDVASFAASPTAYDGYVNGSKNGLKPPRLDNTNGYCIGNRNEPYVVLRVAYPAPVLTTSLIFPSTVAYKGRKARLITATAAFRNEPFTYTHEGC